MEDSVLGIGEKKDFGQGWIGTLIEVLEVTQEMELGGTFIPPIGIEAPFDNFSTLHPEEFYQQFPQLKVKDENRLILDKVREVKLEEGNKVVVGIKRSVFSMSYETSLQVPITF